MGLIWKQINDITEHNDNEEVNFQDLCRISQFTSCNRRPIFMLLSNY